MASFASAGADAADAKGVVNTRALGAADARLVLPGQMTGTDSHTGSPTRLEDSPTKGWTAVVGEPAAPLPGGGGGAGPVVESLSLESSGGVSENLSLEAPAAARRDADRQRGHSPGAHVAAGELLPGAVTP